MRIVSVVASRPHQFKIGSWLIRKELRTDYSHVSFIFWNKDSSKPFYYECVLHGGVTFTGAKFWEERNETVFRCDFALTEENYDLFLDDAMSLCGEEYGLLQNVGIKLSQIFALSYNFLMGASRDKSNCSELIFNFKKYVGLTINKDANLVTPKDIVEACKSL